MSPSLTIHPAFTLAAVPRPVNAAQGKIQVAEVWSSTGSKKRKRTEIATAIDGESVNVYNIQSPGLVTSYAFPPDSTFSCPPCSIRQKATKASPAKRYTYAATTGKSRQISCFTEVSSASTSSVVAPIAPSTYKLGAVASPVVYLDTTHSPSVVEADKPPFNILAVHENGEIQCLTGDLLRQLWAAGPSALADPDADGVGLQDDVVIEFATSTTSDVAKEGLLASRAAVLSFLEDNMLGSSSVATVLLLVSRPRKDSQLQNTGRMVHVLAIYPHAAGSSAGSAKSVQCLFAARLPQPEDALKTTDNFPQYSLHAASGSLYELRNGSLTVYDLSGTVPKVSSRLSLSAKGPASYVRVSPTTAVVAASNSITFYDLHYKSALTSVPLTKPTTLLYYLHSLDLVVALSGNDVLGFQLGGAPGPATTTRKRKHGVLIDSINKGVGKPDRKAVPPEKLPRPFSGYLPGVISIPGVNDVLTKKNKSKLDRYAHEGDVNGFEKTLASLFRVDRDEEELNRWEERRDAWRKAHHASEHLTNGTHTGKEEDDSAAAKDNDGTDFPEAMPLPSWKLPDTSARASERHRFPPVDPALVRYVLKKIFTWAPTKGQDDQPRLTLAFFPPNCFWWLLQSGNFTVNALEAALCRNTAVSVPPKTTIGCVMEAIADYDPTLQLLLSVLAAPIHLGLTEVVRTVKFVLSSGLETRGSSSGPLRITNGITNGEEGVNQSSEAMDLTLQEEEAAAEMELDVALEVLEEGAATKEAALTLALQRLHIFPPQDVVKSLRRELSTHEIVSFVHLLRMQLAAGGWMSRYVDAGFDESDEHVGASDQSVGLISDLLSCALDSIGMSGWLFGNHDPFDAEELVGNLKTEISAVLEGIEEATYLQGLLGQMLVYGKSAAEAPQRTTTPAISQQGQGFVQRRPITVPIHASDGKLLPLGLKAEQAISKLRVGAGGEVKERSARDMGRLRSMRVGKYSLERIVI